MDKLLQIQTELKAPKNQHNNFGNYDYRSAEDILEAVKPLLKETECELTISDEIVEVGGRIYVKATARFKSDDKETVVTAYAREPEAKKGMDESQITGAASSYARKYCLNGLFLIDDNKDADTNEFNEQTGRNKNKANFNKKGLDFDKLREKYSKMTIDELRQEYMRTNLNKTFSDKQREAVLKIIKQAQEKLAKE